MSTDGIHAGTTTALVGDLLRRAAEQRIDVIALTDEELAALEGIDSAQVAPLPWLNAQQGQHREIAAAVGLRGLVARGIAVASEADDASPRATSVSVALPPDVHATLAMRRAAAWILLAEQRTATMRRFRVLYGQRYEVVLDEAVSEGGLHTFSVLPATMVRDTLLAFVDPAGMACEDGPPRRVTVTDLVRGTEPPLGGLEDARIVTVLGRVRLDGSGVPTEDRTSVYVLHDRVEMTAVVDEGDATELEVRTVSANTLRNRLTSLVSLPGIEGA